MKLNKPNVSEILRRAAGATCGPWRLQKQFASDRYNVVSEDNANALVCGVALNDAEFISHAREDVLDLLFYTGKLEGLLNKLLMYNANGDIVPYPRRGNPREGDTWYETISFAGKLKQELIDDEPDLED